MTYTVYYEFLGEPRSTRCQGLFALMKELERIDDDPNIPSSTVKIVTEEE